MNWEPAILAAALVVVIALAFDFSNGFHDASNVVATMISTRAMEPETALLIAAISEFAGPFLFGTAVAKTIGKEIVDPSTISAAVITAALIGALVWNLLTWWWGLPSSSSHALVGGLGGAAIAAAGFGKVKWEGFGIIVMVLVVSPMIGFTTALLFQKFLNFLGRGMTPAANTFFKKSQLVSSVALSLSHGTNDAQKSMGVITMALLALGFQKTFHVPGWVVFLCALAMGLGTAFGGWRIIKTVGYGIYKLRPVHGFAAQTAGAGVILAAALLGGPVSTTHVISSSVMGVGSAERPKAVRWRTAGNIFLAWIFTIPASALMAAVCFILLRMMPWV